MVFKGAGGSVNGLGTLIWSTALRKIMTVITATAAMIVAINQAWPSVEPYYYATRGYARDIVEVSEKKTSSAQDKTVATLRAIQLDQAVGKRDSTANDLAKWTLELNKAPDETSKELIGRQIKTLQNTKSALDNQINTLNRTN